MSDDFNKKRPPDDDDDSLDWLSDEPDQPKGKEPGKLGFTRDLSWLQLDDQASGDRPPQTDDLDLDWKQSQGETPGSGAAAGAGFTGQLDWKKAQPGGDEPGEPDLTNWFADLEAPAPGDAGADEVFKFPGEDEDADDLAPASPTAPVSPPAALDLDALFQMDEPSAEAAPGDLPDWLDLPGDEEAVPQPAQSDLPDWLDAPEMEPSPAAQAPEPDFPDWLQPPAAQDQPAELDAPDWLQAATPEPAQAAAPADDLAWLQQFGEETDFETAPAEATSGAPAEALPDWMQMPDTGMLTSPFAESEAPDQPQAADEMPDWLSADDELPEPAAASAEESTDWMSELDDMLGVEDEESAAEAGEMPDWLTAAQPPTPQPAAPKAGASQDIFGQLGLDSPETGYDFLDQPAAEAQDDVLAGLKLGGDESMDWFAESDAPAEPSTATPGWLESLGELDLSELEAEPAQAAPADADLLPDLGELGDSFDLPDEEPAAVPTLDLTSPGLQDIDAILAAYDKMESRAARQPADEPDLDRLLSDDELEQVNVRRGLGGEEEALAPGADWLSELGASVGEVSAAAILRSQSDKEKPLDELSDRLFALHEKGQGLPTQADAGAANVLRTVLPGVAQFIPAPTIQTGATGIPADIVLNDRQRGKVDLLKTIVQGEETAAKPRASAVDATLDTPNLADMLEGLEPDLGVEAEAKPEAEAVPVARPRARRRLKVDRLALAVLVTLAAIAPFLSKALHIGSLPPSGFAVGSRAQIAYDRLNALRAGEVVLVGVEYGPSDAAELDTMTDAVLRHILAQGAKPALVSTNPTGLLHAQQVMERINADRAFVVARAEFGQPFQMGRHYFVLRYLTGGGVGVRTLAQAVNAITGTDVNGNPSGLQAGSLQFFSEVVVIAGRADDLRNWAEQVAPLTGKPLIGAVSYAAGPLSEPYVLAGAPSAVTGIQGLLVGYADAYTYRGLVDMAVFPQLRPTETTPPPITTLPPPTETTPEVTPTAEATATTEATQAVVTTPEVTESPAATQQAISTVEATESPAATATREASATAAPTDTPAPTATPSDTPTPTATLQPTDTPTAAPSDTPAPTATAASSETPTPAVSPTLPVIRGVVTASQFINVRNGPSITAPPVATLGPGAIVQVIGRNGDGSWLRLRLDTGKEGWVSAQLIAVEEPGGAASPTPEQQTGWVDPHAVVGLMSDVSFGPVVMQVQTPEATAEATSEATAPSAPASPPPDANALPMPIPYRDERWYSMTLGLIAIIFIIAIGAIANILRSLFRRRSR